MGMNWPTMAHICIIFQNAKLSVFNFTNMDSLNSHLMSTVANILFYNLSIYYYFIVIFLFIQYIFFFIVIQSFYDYAMYKVVDQIVLNVLQYTCVSNHDP